MGSTVRLRYPRHLHQRLRHRRRPLRAGVRGRRLWEGRNGGAVSSFMDIQRAEVVRGPQNTLFGRNAIAGAISMTTQPAQQDKVRGAI